MPRTHFLKKEKGRRPAHNKKHSLKCPSFAHQSQGFCQQVIWGKKKQNKLRRWTWRKQPTTLPCFEIVLFSEDGWNTKTPHTLRLSPHLQSRHESLWCAWLKTSPTLQNSLIFTYLKIQWTSLTWLINLPTTTTTTTQSKDKDLQKTETLALCLQLRTRWSWRWLDGRGDRCSLPHRCPK